MANMAPAACAHCDTVSTTEKPLKVCTRCKGASYCDRTCQKAHYQTHKTACLLHKSREDKMSPTSNAKDITIYDPAIKSYKTLKSGQYVHKRFLPTREMPQGYNVAIGYDELKEFDLAGMEEAERMSATDKEAAYGEIAMNFISRQNGLLKGANGASLESEVRLTIGASE